MKQCSKCKEHKTFTEFHKAVKSKDGLQSHCKSCAREATRQYRWSRREQVNEQAKIDSKKPRTRYKTSIRAAAKRGHQWTITEDEFYILLKEECYYCNGQIGDRKTQGGSGLDRIDNDVGYTLTNVLPCCTICNKTRNRYFSVEETKLMINALIEHRKVI